MDNLKYGILEQESVPKASIRKLIVLDFAGLGVLENEDPSRASALIYFDVAVFPDVYACKMT